MLVTELDQVLLGKRTQLELCVSCLIAGGHLLLEDRPGVGKTTLAHALSAAMGLEWARIQFTSDLLPGDITGVSVLDPGSGQFTFRAGPVFTEVLLADEINRAPPRAQSALLEAMEERQISNDGTRYPLPDGFFVVATQNPTDQLGAYPLPSSQLDRFLAAVELGLPTRDFERQMLRDSATQQPAERRQINPVADTAELLNWRQQAQQIHVAERLLDYLQDLLAATRRLEGSDSSSGLSPRAGIGLLAMARAHALIRHRDMVVPEDLQAVFPAVAAHRIAASVNAGSARAQTILDSVSCN